MTPHTLKVSRLVLLALLGGACDVLVTVTGPTVSNSNTNTHTTTVAVDLHDLVTFTPTPTPGNGSPGAPGDAPLPLPATAQATARAVAEAQPALVTQSCQATFGEPAWQFLDRTVAALAQTDARWGYLCKNDCATVSADVIAYRATADQTGVWAVDIIGDHCGTAPAFTWNVLGFDPALVWRARR